MMKYNSFNELETAYCIFSDQEKYKEAIEVLEEGLKDLSNEEVKENIYNIMIEKCWLYCNAGRFEDAIEIFENMINEGYICPIDWNFDELKKHKKYLELVEKNEAVKIETQKKAEFRYVVYTPKDYDETKKYPLFISFHGDGDNIKSHEKHWKSEWLLEQGFIVVYPQSPIVHAHEGYLWIDKCFYDESYETRKYPYLYEKIDENLKACYDSLCSEYSIDKKNIVLGGFSGGAVASINVILSDIIPVKGVIALCSLKPRNFTDAKMESIFKNGTKFIFMDGDEDLPISEVDEMISALKEYRIPYQYYINEGAGHWYPNDLEAKLEMALKFINE